ncbi:hypothetical protein [Amycolatopsis sp. MtRt-6]|uniref:hypothetical protein n=1 Tax=Amycolatopsis sp. MtRt-6 TaxID=2792782 RepID=UPI001A8FB476|nr:hypothetical protein [Amycolatopsis sp. MtRt-6]
MISRAKGFAAAAAAVAATALMPATSAQATTSATYAEFFDNAGFCCSSIYLNGPTHCYNLPTYFVNVISSVKSNTRWKLYSRPGCWSDALLLEGTGDVSNVGSTANDRTISVQVS